ncbi:MAG: hypothetical protein K6G36_01910 [Candidatus Saccharibacteria bacterium]|nr:hypothetical protein [Candidatus Saccharibacteria bacterium]
MNISEGFERNVLYDVLSYPTIQDLTKAFEYYRTNLDARIVRMSCVHRTTKVAHVANVEITVRSLAYGHDNPAYVSFSGDIVHGKIEGGRGAYTAIIQTENGTGSFTFE